MPIDDKTDGLIGCIAQFGDRWQSPTLSALCKERTLANGPKSINVKRQWQTRSHSRSRSENALATFDRHHDRAVEPDAIHVFSSRLSFICTVDRAMTSTSQQQCCSRRAFHCFRFDDSSAIVVYVASPSSFSSNVVYVLVSKHTKCILFVG